MKRICAVLALACAAGCHQAETAAPPVRAKGPSPAQVNPILQASPAALRVTLAEEYRLAPDRRFLLAVPEVDRILTGRAEGQASASFENGSWHVRYGKQEVGTLPEFPSYDDAMSLLTSFAQSRRAPVASANPGDLGEQVDRFEAADVMAALRRADALWTKTRGRELLEPAARGLTYLVAQQLDLFAAGDALPAKAVAAVAVAKALQVGDVRRTEALLAEEMGYRNDASTLARPLDPNDSVRAYILNDDRALERAANDVSAPMLTRYLNVFRAARTRDERQWLTALTLYGDDRRLSLPLVKTGLFIGHFDTDADFSAAAAGLAMEETEETSTANVTVASIVQSANPVAVIKNLANASIRLRATYADRFESDLAQTSAGLSGPFLDAPVRDAYFRAAFYSGVFRFGQHQLDMLSSADAAGSLDEFLGHPRDPRAQQFGKWFHDLVVWKTTQRDLGAFVNDLQQLDRVGEPALARSFEEIGKKGQYSDPRTIAAAQLLFHRADSRPQERQSLSNAASAVLLDLNLTEKLVTSAMALSPDDAVGRVWMESFSGDAAALRRSAADRHLETAARADALEDLEKASAIGEDEYRRAMRDLIREQPASFPLVLAYVEHLRLHKGWREIESVVPAWVRDNPQLVDDPFHLWRLQTRLSEAWLADGNAAAAWDAVGPHLSGWQGGVLMQGALALEGLGRHDEARKLAEQAANRYPDGVGERRTLAEILWRQHDFPAAASALTDPPIAMSAWDWRDIGTSFMKVFGDAPADVGVSAFSELVRRNVAPWDLQQFVYPIDAAGKHELAFRTASQLKTNGLSNFDFLLDDYAYLKAWKGDAEALSWLKQQVPSGRSPASMFIFPHRDLSLLWTFVDQPGSGDEGDFVWLMRAAATLVSPEQRAAHLGEVQAYFSRDGGGGEYFTIGRYLLGMTDESSVLREARNQRQRCEVAYYIGLKAMSQNQLADASDWFRIACETGDWQAGEYRWAKDTLLQWVDRGVSLRVLAGPQN